MFKLTSRIKLFLVLTGFGVFAAIMFTYGYGILESSNADKLGVVTKLSLEMQGLKKEQIIFEQGKKDIATLSEKIFPPQDLFSKDTKVVKEIKILEELAKQNGLEFDLQISGSTKTATKVPGITGELYLVPYSVTITGSFNNIQKYIEAAEHTSFINQTQDISIQAVEGKTRTILNSVFYLKS